MKKVFNYEYEPLPESVEGPILFLCNHNTDFDFMLLGTAINRHAYFVGTENITRMKYLGTIVMNFFEPIIHFKGDKGLLTVKSMLNHIKKGHSVAMFPEGNRSFNGLTCPIPPATGKLARNSGATLVTYRLSGGYLSWPRWGKGIHKGKIRGSIGGIYTHEMLAAMKPEEVTALIEKDLFVDAYADQKKEMVEYKSDHRALGLESTLFMCPECKKIGCMTASDTDIKCTCGWSAEYDNYGYLNDKNGKKLTITELDKIQRDNLQIQMEKAGENDVLFSDDITYEYISREHLSLKKTEAKMTAYKNRFVIGDKVLDFSQISGIAINQRNLLLIHTTTDEGHHECGGPISFSALKYLYLYRSVCGSASGTL